MCRRLDPALDAVFKLFFTPGPDAELAIIGLRSSLTSVDTAWRTLL